MKKNVQRSPIYSALRCSPQLCFKARARFVAWDCVFQFKNRQHKTRAGHFTQQDYAQCMVLDFFMNSFLSSLQHLTRPCQVFSPYFLQFLLISCMDSYSIFFLMQIQLHSFVSSFFLSLFIILHKKHNQKVVSKNKYKNQSKRIMKMQNDIKQSD